MRVLIVATLLLLIPAAVAAQRPHARGRARAEAADSATASDQLGALLASHDRLMQQHAQVEKMFVALSQKVSALGKLSSARGRSQGQVDAATRELVEMNQSFNLQYLGLQNQMQNENRQYSAVSNVIKGKHAAAQNSLGNIR